MIFFVFSVSKQIDLDGQYLKKTTIDLFQHLKTLGFNFSIYLESCCFVSFLFIFFSQLYIDRVACSSLSVEECRSLGFVTTDLICGACDELDQFNLSSLKESCLKCCQKEDTENEALKVSYLLKFSVLDKQDTCIIGTACRSSFQIKMNNKMQCNLTESVKNFFKSK